MASPHFPQSLPNDIRELDRWLSATPSPVFQSTSSPGRRKTLGESDSAEGVRLASQVTGNSDYRPKRQKMASNSKDIGGQDVGVSQGQARTAAAEPSAWPLQARHQLGASDSQEVIHSPRSTTSVLFAMESVAGRNRQEVLGGEGTLFADSCFPMPVDTVSTAFSASNDFFHALDATSQTVIRLLGSWLAGDPAPLPVAASDEEHAPLSAVALRHAFAAVDNLLPVWLGARSTHMAMKDVSNVWTQHLCVYAPPLRSSFVIGTLQSDLRLLDVHTALAWALMKLAPRNPVGRNSSARSLPWLKGTQDSIRYAVVHTYCDDDDDENHHTALGSRAAGSEKFAISTAAYRHSSAAIPADQIQSWLHKRLHRYQFRFEHSLELEDDETLAAHGVDRKMFHGPQTLMESGYASSIEDQIEFLRTMRRAVAIYRLHLPCIMSVLRDEPHHSAKYLAGNDEWRRLFGFHRRLNRVQYESPFPAIWADPSDEQRTVPIYMDQMRKRQEWMMLHYRCLQAVHKATGKVLDNSCDLKMTPDSWRFLATQSKTKWAPIPEGFDAQASREGRDGPGKPHLRNPARGAFGILCHPRKPVLAEPGTTGQDIRFMLDQLEWRVFNAKCLAHNQYYPSGRLRAITIVVTSVEFTDEVRPAAEVAKGVYEPLTVREELMQHSSVSDQNIVKKDDLVFVDRVVAAGPVRASALCGSAEDHLQESLNAQCAAEAHPCQGSAEPVKVERYLQMRLWE